MPLITLDDADTYREVQHALTGHEPVFLGRIGGVDTEVAMHLADGGDLAAPEFRHLVDFLKRYAGYYDFRDDFSDVSRFARLLTGWYKSCDLLSVGHQNFLAAFFEEKLYGLQVSDREAIARSERYVRLHVAGDRFIKVFSYTFIEGLLGSQKTIFSVFADVLPGKRVMVISPFSQTIEEQYPQRHNFFPGYAYPEFQLVTYNTPMTFAGLSPDFYPDDSWFASVDRMRSELRNYDFDIALLACGGYAMPLGCYIRDELNKKAVYVGGVLQLFFGVMGRRFESPFYQRQINTPVFVRPKERSLLTDHLRLAPDEPTEALGAYF